MANRFETPINSQFMNTYVPIPFDAMMKAGQMKQQKYDQTAGAIDQSIQRAEMLNAVPGSPDEAYKNKTVQTMYDIRDQYVGKDLSDPFVYRQLNNDINKNVDKTRLQRAEQNFTNWQGAEQGKRTLALNGKYNAALEKDSPSLYDASTGQVRNYTPRAFKTKDELFQPFYQHLKPKSHLVNEHGYEIMRDEISLSDTKSVAAANAQGLAGTPEGQDIIDLYKQANRGTKLSDVEILKSEMNDYGKDFTSSNDTVLAATLQGGAGTSKTKGALDSEWFVPGGAKSVSGQNTDRKALKAVDAENEVNKTSLLSVDAALKDLTDNNVPTTDIRYKSALQQKEKLTNDIGKYEESMAQVNTNTEVAMQKKVEDLKSTMAPTIAKTLGVDENTVRSLLDEHLNQQFGKGVRKTGAAIIGGKFGPIEGVSNAAALVPGVVGMIVNGLHRNLNVLGITSEKDKTNLLDAIDKAVADSGVTENSSFTERASAGLKGLTNYVRSSRVGWGSSIKKDILDNNFLYQMRKFDKQINALESNRDQVRSTEKAAIFNYNVSDMMVKPLNYTTKQGRISIITPNGIEHDSQINDFYTALKISPSSYEIKDVSEGNKLTTGTKKFNQEVQSIMASYDPLPGMIIPNVDKDGNVKVLVSYQLGSSSKGTGVIKKFEVKVKDPNTINAFANDYAASGYTNSYLRLVNRKIHQDVETYANSKSEHDYPIMVPKKGGGTEEASITGKRIGSEYVAIDPATKDVLIEKSSDGTTREVRFNTKEEFENWLYAKQHFLLTGQN